MPKNPILEELYAVRSQIQAEHGDHRSAYLHSEFERLKAGGHPVAHDEYPSDAIERRLRSAVWKVDLWPPIDPCRFRC